MTDIDPVRLGNMIADVLEKHLARFHERLDSVERQLKALPDSIARHARDGGLMSFRGTWQGSRKYERGAAVVHAGTLWVAVDDAPPGATPGKGSEWRLTIKNERTR